MSGLETLLFGTAGIVGAETALAAGATSASVAATSGATAGLIGSGGAFGAGGTLLTGTALTNSLILGAGGLGAYSSMEAAEAQADAAAFNAASLGRAAEREKAISDMEAASFRKNQMKLLAQARTESGNRDATGTAIRLDDEAVEDIAYQEAIIRAGGHLAGDRLRDEAELASRTGSYARKAGLIRAGTTLAHQGSRLSFFG